MSRRVGWLRLACIALVCAGLAACAAPSSGSRAGFHPYGAPGPAGDPWGPYIRQAAARFDVPEAVIRQVMHRESGGNPRALSNHGAIGLMQLKPGTYAEMRRQYGLGRNPYDPRDNILAGTAYLMQLRRRFGPERALIAYREGPARVSAP